MMTDIVVIDSDKFKTNTQKPFFRSDFLKQSHQEIDENQKISEEEQGLQTEDELESQRTINPYKSDSKRGF